MKFFVKTAQNVLEQVEKEGRRPMPDMPPEPPFAHAPIKPVVKKTRTRVEEYQVCPHCGEEIGEKAAFGYDDVCQKAYAAGRFVQMHGKCGGHFDSGPTMSKEDVERMLGRKSTSPKPSDQLDRFDIFGDAYGTTPAPVRRSDQTNVDEWKPLGKHEKPKRLP